MVNNKVWIEWLDSHGIDNGWQDRNDLKALLPVKIVSMGWLCDEGDDYYTIAMSISDDVIDGRMTIPKCCVLRILRMDVIDEAK